MVELPQKVNSGQDKKGGIRILLADDHPLLRQALRNELEKQEDFEIVAEAGDGAEAVSLAKQLLPDVVIMDISMPKLNGLEATRQIKQAYPNMAILVLTVHDDSEHILSILESGATGYLAKSVFGEDVIHAVRGVVSGDTVLSTSISQQIIKHAIQHVTRPTSPDTGARLTSRELTILQMAAKGMSNRDIAAQSNLSIRTVKSYFGEIFSKLNVKSRTEAVITVLRAGVITLDDLD